MALTEIIVVNVRPILHVFQKPDTFFSTDSDVKKGPVEATMNKRILKLETLEIINESSLTSFGETQQYLLILRDEYNTYSKQLTVVLKKAT